LPRDKFMLQQISENSGYVPIATIASFARMKALTPNVEQVVEALKASAFLEISECGANVKRRVPYNPEEIGELDGMKNAVYVKGFPSTASLEELQEFFAATFPESKALAIRMRKMNDDAKTFKGSVFVELESAEKALAIAASTGIKYNGESDLVFKTKEKYFADENEEKTERQKNKDLKKKKQSEPAVSAVGCLIKFTAGIPQGIHGKAVRAFVNSLELGSEAKFVDTEIEGCQCAVRFAEPVAEAAVSKINELQTKFPVQAGEDSVASDEVLVAQVIDGEQEIAAFMAKANQSMRNSKRRKF